MLKVLVFTSLFHESTDFEDCFLGIGHQHFRNSHYGKKVNSVLLLNLDLDCPLLLAGVELLVSAQEKGCGTLYCHAYFTGPWSQPYLQCKAILEVCCQS